MCAGSGTGIPAWYRCILRWCLQNILKPSLYKAFDTSQLWSRLPISIWHHSLQQLRHCCKMSKKWSVLSVPCHWEVTKLLLTKLKISNTGGNASFLLNILTCVSFSYISIFRKMASLLGRNVTLPSLSAQIHLSTNTLKLTNHRGRFINLLVANTATKSPVMVSSFCACKVCL